MLANTVTGLTVAARGWRQINAILGKHAPGATQGYVWIRKMSGNNPFLAYGVINDGGAPGERSGDGAYLPARERIHDPGADGTADREVLEAFYDATDGASWNNRTNWLSDMPLSEWHGVTTDGRGRVTGLALRDNRLRGGIPTELAGLTRLRVLSLGYNELSGRIPTELDGLTRLQWLSLGFNQLSGGIPTELGELTHLQWLDLGFNELSGRIPTNMQQLSELTLLDIRDTDVCVPKDAALQTWLATLSRFRSSGLVCDGTRRVLFSASSYEVTEGETVTVSVRLVDLTGGPVRSVEMALTATPGGGATAADYSGVPERVTIMAPATEAGFVFTAVADGPFDDGETVVLGFQQPLPSGVRVGSPETATVTIQDPGTEQITDREVLDALYHATGGPDWNDRTNWLSAAPLSEWFGVGSDDNGRVTSLSLAQNGLSGAIPPALSQLTHLQELDLGQNKLSGTIPPELIHLTNLQELNLNFNELNGVIPLELAQLTNLQSLHLADNELSGGIPPELAQLTNLQSLFLSRNELSGGIPLELAQLTNLRGLNLRRNELSGEIPPELGGLAHLQSLNLSRNELSGGIPPELGGLVHLRLLSLDGNELSGTIPPELAQLTNLYALTLNINPELTGTLPPGLQQLPLSIVHLFATSVCVPEDEELHEWLAGIRFFKTSGLTCGRPAPAMSSIDVAVVYTPVARQIAGGTAEIEADIDLMMAETNQAFLDGGVTQRVALVSREEVEYTESGDSNLDLGRLGNPSDGHMDEVHAIRDRAGADLVHLILDMTDFRGLAGFPRPFSLTCAGCDAWIFAHELGHNMGLHHDRYVEHTRSFPYSHGYVNQRAFADGAPESARWKTIMAYTRQCEDSGFLCDELLRFSNPNQTYLGDPLGVPGDERTSAVDGPADAVRVLNFTRHSVAGFRPGASGNRLTLSSIQSQARPALRSGEAVMPVPRGNLFRAVAPNAGGAASRRTGRVLDRATLRRREVSVDIGRLARVPDGGLTALSLNLFDDVVLTGIFERRAPTYSGGYALSGRLAGVAGGSVTVVVNGSVVAGTVRIPGATFRIRPAGPGRHAIMQIDPSQLPQACGTVRQTPGFDR